MSESKPTNPKDLIGSDKLPMHLWPTTATIYGVLGLLDGALKYGRSNYRVMGVKSSIYYDAARRHLDAWFEGEDTDAESGLPHLGHALACLAILVDSTEKGNLTDDRMYPGGFRSCVEKFTKEVKRLKEKYRGREVKHYTIADADAVKTHQGGMVTSDTPKPLGVPVHLLPKFAPDDPLTFTHQYEILVGPTETSEIHQEILINLYTKKWTRVGYVNYRHPQSRGRAFSKLMGISYTLCTTESSFKEALNGFTEVGEKPETQV